MVNGYSIAYGLTDSKGQVFDPCHAIYTANIIAESPTNAIAKLKAMFNMLTVNIIGWPKSFQMSDDEYMNG